jgi:PAS domain S-box-containing protein
MNYPLPALLFQLTSLLAAVGHLALGAWVLVEDARSRVNRLFAFVSLTFFVWSAGWGMFVAAPDLQSALFWERLGLPGWILPPALLLHLFLIYTGDRRKQLPWWQLVGLYAPPLVLLLANIGGPVMSESFVHSSLGWVEGQATGSFWFWCFVVYAFGFSGLTLARIWMFGRRTKLLRERRSARLLFLSGASSVLLGALLGVLPAGASGVPLPNLGSYAIIIWSIGIAYCINRYKLLLLTPETAAQGILQGMHEAVLLLGDGRRILFANPAAGRLLGPRPAQLEGRDLDELDAGGLTDILQPILAGGVAAPSPPSEHRLGFRDGREPLIVLHALPMTDEFGQLFGVAVVIRDQTERRLLEERLVHADRSAQQDRLTSVGMLAASVAHEINNPLGYMVTNLEFVRDHLSAIPLPGVESPDKGQLDDVKRAVTDALEGADRVRRIVNDLGSFTRLNLAEATQRVVVAEVLESALALAGNELRHRARVERRFEPLPSIMVNEGRLCQVFLNLIVNAAQAIPAGRAGENTVTVRTWSEPTALCIEVRDTGEGIPPGVIDRIFEPFHTTRSELGGTGLGLPICNRIVVELGGSLRVTSEEGVGSSFVVRLPTSLVADGVPVVEETSGRPVQAPVVGLERPGPPADEPAEVEQLPRLLLVDDEPLLLAAIGRQLRRSFRITTASSGRGAILVLEEGQNFDVIVTDLMMPDLSGRDLYNWICKRRPELESRVLFLTGGAFTPHQSEFLLEHANRTLSKPTSREILVAAAERVVRERGRA